MDLDVLLVDYFLDTSAVWRLCWQHGFVVRVRRVLSGWDEMNFVRDVLVGWVEMNFDNDVGERSDRCLRKSDQRLMESGRCQRNDRNQRNNRCPMDDRQQMNHRSRGIAVFWSDLESKNENNDPLDAPDNKKGLDRIVDHGLASTHREYRHAYLRKADRI